MLSSTSALDPYVAAQKALENAQRALSTLARGSANDACTECGDLRARIHLLEESHHRDIAAKMADIERLQAQLSASAAAREQATAQERELRGERDGLLARISALEALADQVQVAVDGRNIPVERQRQPHLSMLEESQERNDLLAASFRERQALDTERAVLQTDRSELETDARRSRSVFPFYFCTSDSDSFTPRIVPQRVPAPPKIITSREDDEGTSGPPRKRQRTDSRSVSAPSHLPQNSESEEITRPRETHRKPTPHCMLIAAARLLRGLPNSRTAFGDSLPRFLFDNQAFEFELPDFLLPDYVDADMDADVETPTAVAEKEKETPAPVDERRVHVAPNLPSPGARLTAAEWLALGSRIQLEEAFYAATADLADHAALSALNAKQLRALCVKHGVDTTSKNVDMVSRLHAYRLQGPWKRHPTIQADSYIHMFPTR
ncbi:hypothetical protein DFH09DRAFT_1147847 [Mycena vulgaris]|nr:hypothetical protein DFH09DRAFT_1147847 [Mycena vulgaris]